MIEFLSQIDVFEWTMIGLLFVLLSLAIFLLIVYANGNKHGQEIVPSIKNLPGVSVLICAHNEEKNLMNNLPVILEQNYPNFQVIVVNDASWDGTHTIIETFQRKYKNLHLVTIEETSHRKPGKKLPMTIGIKAAVHDYILCTDADCVPISDRWIEHMVQPVLRGSKVVLGYSPSKKETGWGKAFSRFDSLLTAASYLSWARAGLAYMGVGRNLLYSKELFHSLGGFKSHYHITSGDDDLFVNMVSKRTKVAVVDSKESIVYTKGQSSFIRFFRQKKRHFTTGVRYRFIHKVILTLPWLFHVLFLSSFILNLLLGNWLIACVCLAVYFSVRWLIWFSYGKKLLAKSEAFLLPFYEMLTLILYPVIWIAQKFRPVKGW